MIGADWDNIAFKCIDIDTDVYVKPCKNCEKTFSDLKNLGGK